MLVMLSYAYVSRMCANVSTVQPSLVFSVVQGTEGFLHGDVGAWIAWRMRTFFIPCLASCIIFMPNRGEMVFFRTRKRDFQGKENLLLRERDKTSILFCFNSSWQYTGLFWGLLRQKKGKEFFFSFSHSRIHILLIRIYSFAKFYSSI